MAKVRKKEEAEKQKAEALQRSRKLERSEISDVRNAKGESTTRESRFTLSSLIKNSEFE